MTKEANKAVVRRFFLEAWNQNKIDSIEEYLSADNVHYFGAQSGRLGPNEFREIIKNWRRGFPDFQYHIEDTIAEGDRVVTRVRFTGTHTGPFDIASRTISASNRPIDEAEILIMRVASGKIIESWATWNRLGVLSS